MKAIIFDVDDTLYDRLEPFRAAYDTHFSGRWDLPRRLVYDAFSRRGQEVFEDSMNQKITMEEMYIYRIKHAMQDFGAVITDQEALDFQDAYLWQQHHLRFSPGMKETLDLCRERGVFLGAITNGPSDHQREKYRALQLGRWIPPDRFLASGDVGVNKPDPAIFHIAARRWQLVPEETFFAGDSYSHDIAGAKRAGLGTIWLDKSGGNPLSAFPLADYIVRDGNALYRCAAQLLGC